MKKIITQPKTQNVKSDNVKESVVPLLTLDDPLPYEIIKADASAPLLITAEHAGKLTPSSLGLMGLAPEDFDQHYAYDPGVRDLSIALAEKMDATAILGTYSRIVTDLNRRANDTAFPTLAEGKPIDVNAQMTAEDKAQRFEALYYPYNKAIEAVLEERFAQKGVVPFVVSIHSYTPVYHGEARPWEVGILWVQDRRLPDHLLQFYRSKGYSVGDNQPYNAQIMGGSAVNRHADARRLPNVLFEYRNDILRTDAQIEKEAALLCAALQKVMDDEAVRSLYDGPEHVFDPQIEADYFAKVMKTVTDK